MALNNLERGFAVISLDATFRRFVVSSLLEAFSVGRSAVCRDHSAEERQRSDQGRKEMHVEGGKRTLRWAKSNGPT